MDGADIYNVWVGDDNPWELWVKPALFAQLDDELQRADAPGGHIYRGHLLPWSHVDVSWAPDATPGTFILVDLEGASSIELGLALMSRGYRPVISINTCTGPKEAVQMTPVLRALREGASYPYAFPHHKGAPPTFILDVRRMSPTRPVAPGVFDNRWMALRQDFPSANLLRRRGLSRVIVVLHEHAVADDLRHVVYAWQQGGIEILVKRVDRDLPVGPMAIQSPSWFRRILRRPKGVGDLQRNMQGSFGARIPKPRHG